MSDDSENHASKPSGTPIALDNAPSDSPLAKRKRTADWSGEKPHEHRSLLLWAMQDEQKRSYRCVASSMSRSDSTVRGWAKKHSWTDRAAMLGDTAQAIAIRLYRTLYLSRYGQREVASVETNMSVPFLATEVAPVDGVGGGKKLEQQHTLDRDQNQRTAKRHLGLLDAAIGTLARDITNGKAKLNMRDLPHFLRARYDLADVLLPTAAANTQGVVTSVRVRMATASGSSRVRAMYEDSQEVTAILGALVTREEVAAEGLNDGGEVVELQTDTTGNEQVEAPSKESAQ